MATPRAGQRKRRRSGSLKEVTLMVFTALEEASSQLSDDSSAARLKAAYCIFSGAAAYARLHETSDLALRLSRLEANGPA
jgi:hypothetical protein